MKKTTVTVAVTAVATGLLIKFCGEFAWNVIASICATLIVLTLDKVDAPKV